MEVVPMHRRDFLVRTGLFLGAVAAAPPLSWAQQSAPADWSWFRSQFELDPSWLHLSAFFLASHPKPVRDAIETHRRGLDRDPVGYYWGNIQRLERGLLGAAGQYLQANPMDIAFTDSTTMGLGLLYGQLQLKPGQEILTTIHDHYSTEEALRYRAERTGTKLNRIALYDQPAEATAGQMVERITRAVTPRTRAVAVTWVHSSTGVKLPLRQIADALATINAGRAESDRALLCVDGVHGLGTQNETVEQLGCDFLIAGTHKWLFGPRGTGIVWGNDAAWKAAYPTIPTFWYESYMIWEKEMEAKPVPMAALMTPGGFHSFEHRWALAQAFEFHQRVGKQRIAGRIRELNGQFREEVRRIPKVTLHTPRASEISGGINCFELDGISPAEVVNRLASKKIRATVTPYTTKYARLAFGAYNTREDVETTLRAIREIAG